MARLTKSLLAESDLDNIWLYIAQDNPTAADRLIDKIVGRAWTYAENPSAGRSRDDLIAGLHCFPMDAYVVFYVPIEGGIRLVRIMHGARDVNSDDLPLPE